MVCSYVFLLTIQTFSILVVFTSLLSNEKSTYTCVIFYFSQHDHHRTIFFFLNVIVNVAGKVDPQFISSTHTHTHTIQRYLTIVKNNSNAHLHDSINSSVKNKICLVKVLRSLERYSKLVASVSCSEGLWERERKQRITFN